MASKKNKKSKGVTMSLGDFVNKVEEGTGAPTAGAGQNVVYAEKKKGQNLPFMSSWADEVDEDGAFYEKERIILPSAPRASRGPAYADQDIPQHPPFTAHLGNLPYDIDEDEIYKFFRDLALSDLKLPRDQQTNRLRGFGYAEFSTREDLIEALVRNEQMVRGRPIRITLGNGQQDRRGGDMDRGGMRGDGDRRRGRPPAEDDEVDDWRSMMKPQDFQGGGGGGGGEDFRRGPPPGDYGSMPRSGFRDRGFDRGPPRGGPRGPPPEDIEFSRSAMVQGPPPSQPPSGHYNTYGGRSSGGGSRGGGGYGRDRDYDRGYGDRGYGGGGGGGGSDFYRGGPPHHQQGSGYYPPSSSQHSRHHSESSDHGGPPREESTWRRREHTLSQSSQNSSHYPMHPPAPRSERSESPPLRQNLHRSRSPSERGGDSDGYGRDRDGRSSGPSQPEPPKERKRLVLQPRTVDKPVGESDPPTASSIFGGAKPVDTTRREREIEEKLEKLKVDEPEGKEGSDDAAAGGSSDQGGPAKERRERGAPPSGERPPRDGDRDRDRDRGERPKPFRLLTRASSGGGSKEAYIELESPVTPLGGTGIAAPPSSSSASRSRMGGPMRAPPPLPITPPQTQQQAYSSQRFNLLRSDEKDRGGPSYRGRGSGSRGGGGRDLDRDGRDRPSGGRGGEFSRRGPRDHDGGRDGPVRGGGGRSFDRDHGGPRGGRGGDYGRGGDFGDRRRDDGDFRRGPPHHNNNQSSSIGSQSEERDRDSHSEPEDDRDMMRGGDRGPADKAHGGDFSDEDGDFTRVEHRRGRKSYNNRVNNNQMSSSSGPSAGRPLQQGGGGGGGGARINNDRW